jgi:hypothetical protein
MMSFFRHNDEFRAFLPIELTRLRRSEATARVVYANHAPGPEIPRPEDPREEPLREYRRAPALRIN